MSERSRRMRRQISEVTEDSSEQSEAESDDFDPRRSDASRRAGSSKSAPSNTVSRSKRGTAGGPPPSTIQRSAASSTNDEKRQSIKLTMKVAPSKLREVMRANEVESLQDTLGGGQVITGPRTTRQAARKPRDTSASRRRRLPPLGPNEARRAGGRGGTRYTQYAESDSEEEDEEEEDDDEEEDEGEEEEESESESEDGPQQNTMLDDLHEVGAEAEGGTDDEDVEMEDAPVPPKRAPPQPKPPKITLKASAPRVDARQPVKPKLIVTPANVGPVKSVEDQEMEDDPGDDEVEGSSDLSDNEENTNLNDEDDIEGEDDEDDEEEENEEGGEDDEMEGEEDGEEDEEGDDDSGDETPASGMATPDPARMTQRQRGRTGEQLMALDMAPQQRKFFTDAEKAMKKDEHARKRKELTKRKTQEEKTAALNRLLKPQASKSRGAAPKAETLAANLQTAMEEDEVEIRADPLYTRWISTRDGFKLGVPEEWLGKHVGKHFGPPLAPSGGALVQEME